jgi:hypothetical protein
MGRSESNQGSGPKAVAPKKSAGKTTGAATLQAETGQMTRTRQSIVRYIREVASDTLWHGVEDMEEWEMLMADDCVAVLDALADAIEEFADRNHSTSRLLPPDRSPRGMV